MREAGKAAKSLYDTAELGMRVINPVYDVVVSTVTGRPKAAEEVRAGIGGAAQAGMRRGQFGSRLMNPYADEVISQRAGRPTARQELVANVENWAADQNRKLNPYATPKAETFGGELHRNFDIGANQGELMFDVGTAVVGGPGAKVVGRMATARAPLTAAYYKERFNDAKLAAYFAEPYDGMGHHYIPRRTLKKNDFLSGFGESEFNLLKPGGMTKGQFFERHYAVDPGYYGGRVRGGGGWSGEKLGFRRYGALGRAWHGAPGALRARAIGAPLAAGAVAGGVDE